MLNLRAAKMSTNSKTLKFRAAKLKGFTVHSLIYCIPGTV